MGDIGAYEGKPQIVSTGLIAGSDLTDNQYYAVKLSSDVIELCDTLGEFTLGILFNAPDEGEAASVVYGGIFSPKIGGTVSQQNRLVVDVDGMLIAQTDPDEAVIAIALSDGSDGDRIPCIICLGTALNSAVADRALADGKVWLGNGSGEAAAVTMTGDVTMSNAGVTVCTDIDTTAASDASGDLIYRDSATTFERLAKGTTVQILAMNSGATAPEWIAQSAITSAAQTDLATTAAGDASGDILMRDSASTFERLAKGTTGQYLQMDGGSLLPEWVSMSGDVTLADGVATCTDVTVGSDATGDILYKSSATALARLGEGTANDILQQGGSNAPQWATVSGDVTIADGGAVTIANDSVTPAMLGSVAAGGHGIIIKGTNTANAITELNVPIGNVVVGTTNDITVLDMGATGGNIMVDSGTAPASVAVSGDATLAAGGALTLAKTFMRQATTNWSAAEVKAGDATPLVLVDFSAEVGLGTVASGDALIFHHLIANISGGGANYDQNENSIIKYQTAGGGATVSLTLANWFNGAGADTLVDIKQLATVVVPDADEDLVWTMSASPYNAAGDRLLRVTCYYSVFTPA